MSASEVLFSLYRRVPPYLYRNWHVGSDIPGCEAYAETKVSLSLFLIAKDLVISQHQSNQILVMKIVFFSCVDLIF